MTTFKLSVFCDSIEEFQRVATLLLAKGVQDAGCSEDRNCSCADNRGGSKTGTRDQGAAPEPAASSDGKAKAGSEPVPEAKPRGRGRPKTKAPELTLPGTPPAVTLAVVTARAKKFAQQWGAPSLVEVLTAFNVKTTTDLKPDQYEAIMKAFDEFTMGEDEPEGDVELVPLFHAAEEYSAAEKTNEDPFNDLL